MVSIDPLSKRVPMLYHKMQVHKELLKSLCVLDMHTYCIVHREQACQDLYSRHGSFYQIDFLATQPKAAGKGLASVLMSHLLHKADSEQKAMFLVAINARLR